MTDRPSVLCELSRSTSPLPPSMCERILSGTRTRISRRRRARQVAVVLTITLIAGLVGLMLDRQESKAPRVAIVLSARDAAQGDDVVQEGEWLESGAPIEVEPNGGIRVSTGAARVIAAGDSRFFLTSDGLSLERGAVDIEGHLTINGPQCEVDIRGRAAAERVETYVLITLFAGSITTREPRSSCHILDLTGRDPQAEPADEPRQEVPQETETALQEPEAPGPGAVTSSQEPGAMTHQPESTSGHVEGERLHRQRDGADTEEPEESELAGQVTAFQGALRLSRSDPGRALGAWRTLREQHPTSPLRQEIDFYIVDTLSRLDRTVTARAEAEAFVARYPRSPRAAEMRRTFTLSDE